MECRRNQHEVFQNNSTESCRICMKQTDNMNLIFTANTSDLVEKILFCTGVHLMEVKGLPSLICSQCIEDLTTSYNFKTTCVMSNNMYYKMLCNNIKKEDIKIELSGDNCHVDFDVKGVEDSLEDMRKSIRITKGIERTDLNSNLKKKIGMLKTKKKTKPVQPRPVLTVQCEICHISFKNKIELARHNKTEHKTIWMCEVCARVCRDRAALECHALSHAPRSLQCAHCQYATANKSDLRTHLRRHTGIKQYQCESCSAAFYTVSNLHSHRYRKHLRRAPRFKCTMCDKMFYDKTKLNLHVDSHLQIKRHECEVCRACFTRRSYWKLHLEKQHSLIVPPAKPGPRKKDEQTFLANSLTTPVKS